MLPIDSNIFRGVVLNRYVFGRGGKDTWHAHLIQHFQVFLQFSSKIFF